MGGPRLASGEARAAEVHGEGKGVTDFARDLAIGMAIIVAACVLAFGGLIYAAETDCGLSSASDCR